MKLINTMRKIKKVPLVCLIIATTRLLFGRLRLSGKYNQKSIKMEDENFFKVFRHIQKYPLHPSLGSCVFVVRFKFSRLSFTGNRIASFIPMLLIAGFPGFQQKIYAVNESNGYWQGMYQWQSKEYLEAYKKSFVYRMMNKRAIKESIQSFEIEKQQLNDYVNYN